jgi:hypothetical protein
MFFFQECGPLLERGMVMGVLDHAFDVIVLKLGVTKRVYVEVITVINSFDYIVMKLGIEVKKTF